MITLELHIGYSYASSHERRAAARSKVQRQVSDPEHSHHPRKGDVTPTGYRTFQNSHFCIEVHPQALQWNGESTEDIHSQKIRVAYLPPEGQPLLEEEEDHARAANVSEREALPQSGLVSPHYKQCLPVMIRGRSDFPLSTVRRLIVLRMGTPRPPCRRSRK